MPLNGAPNMSFLSDAVSQAEQQVKINTTGQISAVKAGLKGDVANLKNTASSLVSGAVNNTVKSAFGAVSTSLGDLLTGNVSGAADTLLNAPSNILNSALSGLGGFGGSTSLAAPGTFSALSSYGAAEPGNPLAGAMARPDPTMNFTWYAQLPVISPGSTQSAVNAASTSVLASIGSSVLSGVSNALSSAMGGSVSTSQSAQLPWYYVEEATLPFRQFASRAIFREGRDRNYPEKYTVDALHLSIYSDSQNNAFKYLQAWNNAIITPFSAATSGQLAGGWGRPSDYKKPIYIYMLDVTHSVMAIIQYTECWPMTVDTYQMTSGSSERIVNHVNFSVGDVFINLMDVTPTLSSALQSGIVGNLGTAISGLTSKVPDLISGGVSLIGNGVSSFFDATAASSIASYNARNGLG